MKKYRFVFVSSLRPFLLEAVKTLSAAPFVEDVLYFENGAGLLDYFHKERNVDFLIIDTMINISVSEAVDRLSQIPNLKTIVLTNATQGSDANFFAQGASLVMVKPENILYLKRMLYNYIVYLENAELHYQFDEKSVTSIIDRKVIRTLLEYDIKCNNKGYTYLRFALVFILSERFHAVNDTLYQIIANRFNTTIPCVERAIRHSITTSYNRRIGERHQRRINELFRHGKISNYEFILKLAELVKVSQA